MIYTLRKWWLRWSIAKVHAHEHELERQYEREKEINAHSLRHYHAELERIETERRHQLINMAAYPIDRPRAKR